MIAAIIFSRDRACQLDLLLHSLEENAPGLFGPVHVLWRATDRSFRAGYETCASDHAGAFFVPEDELAVQVRFLLREPEFACFFTDDDVLYRAAPTIPPQHAFDRAEVICFSLRLGMNTTVCYPHGRSQTLPAVVQDGDIMVWDWTRAERDFGYPGSLDGHVFRGATLRTLLASARFPNPNWLEDELMARVLDVGKPLMAAYGESRLVSIPANQVSESHLGNRHGERHPVAAATLNERYLAGERINLAAMDFGSVCGAHHELPYVFA